MILMLITSFLFVSCASKQTMLLEQTKITSPPKLLFLNYNITKNSDGKKAIQFINKIITDGKLKTIANSNYEKNYGDLECAELDENLNTIERIHIKDPLVKIFEYVNDFDTFETKMIEVDSSQFSVRLQLHENTKFIAINEITNSDKENKTLIITKLN